ncbi:MAG: phosphatidate cytidylyltransferase [Chloroflexia bacterium]
MLGIRVLSAVVLIPPILVVIALGEPHLALLVAAVIGLALEEAYGLVAATGLRPVRWAGFLSALLFIVAALTTPAEGGCGCLLRLPGIGEVALPWTVPGHVGVGAALAGAILLTLSGQLLRRDRGGALASWGLTLSGTLYVSWPLSHLILLRELGRPDFVPPFWQALGGPDLGAGFWWIVALLALVWLCDTAAYFVGIRWGRHKMSPYLSPKKSWEGAAAGMLSSIAAALGLVPLLGLPLSYPWAALLGLLVGTLGQVGDLAESLLKRQAGVKDSGRLIPGHGGMLDRVDSLLFVVPAAYYFLILVLR